MLQNQNQNRTERIVAVWIAIIVVEIEHTRIRTIIVIATTFEKRIIGVRKVGVVQFNP